MKILYKLFVVEGMIINILTEKNKRKVECIDLNIKKVVVKAVSDKSKQLDI